MVDVAADDAQEEEIGGRGWGLEDWVAAWVEANGGL